MNDLREQIKELVRQQQFMSDDGGLVADRILAAIHSTSEPEAKVKLPKGLDVKLSPNGRYAITRGGYWEQGWYDPEADTLAAALEAPPVPTETKSRDVCKPSPVVTHADMRRLAAELMKNADEIDDESESFVIGLVAERVREVFNEPA